MTSGYNQAKDEMLAVFNAVWEPTGFFVAWDDVTAEPTENTWSRVTIKHTTGEQKTFADSSGTAMYERTGILCVQLFTPMGDGNTSAGDLADSITTAYEKAKGDCVTYTNVRVREIGQSGAFEQMNVLCDFSYRYAR